MRSQSMGDESAHFGQPVAKGDAKISPEKLPSSRSPSTDSSSSRSTAMPEFTTDRAATTVVRTSHALRLHQRRRHHVASSRGPVHCHADGTALRSHVHPPIGKVEARAKPLGGFAREPMVQATSTSAAVTPPPVDVT